MKTPPVIACWLSEVRSEAQRLNLTTGDYLSGKQHASGWEGLHERISFQHEKIDPPMIFVHLPWGHASDGKDYPIDQRDRCSPEEHESVSYGIAVLAKRFPTSMLGIYYGAPYRTIPAGKPFSAQDVERWCCDALHHERRIPIFDASNNNTPDSIAGKRVNHARSSQPNKLSGREAIAIYSVPPETGGGVGAIGTPLNYYKDPKIDWICDVRKFWSSNLNDGMIVPPAKVAGRLWLFEDWHGYDAIKRANYQPVIRAYKSSYSIAVQPPWQDQPDRMTVSQIIAAAA